MKPIWKLKLKAYFSFNHYEKIIVWIFITLLIVLSGTMFYVNRKHFDSHTPLTNNKALTDSLQKLISNRNEKKQTETAQPFYFNPNTADSSTLVSLGFYPKLAARLIKYRTKAPFKKPDDLKKLYGINDDFVDDLASFMIFEKAIETPIITTKIPASTIIKENIKIELNTAQAEEFMLMKGVGIKLSKRIVTYRENLGGFLNQWQLLEVWGIDSSIIIQNEELFTIDTSHIQHISINTADWKTLNKHPYIQGREASLIINYRLQHGNYQSINDVKEIKALSKEFIDKIEPYLIFE